MLVDPGGRVLAASGETPTLQERFALAAAGRASGFYRDAGGTVVAFHITPGYETYRGPGWYGVIVQQAGSPERRP
jgi:hypothetical protein